MIGFYTQNSLAFAMQSNQTGDNMIRVIKTSRGQMLAKTNDDKNESIIIDGDTMLPVAVIKTVDRDQLIKAIRRISSLIKIKSRLADQGVTLNANLNGLTPIKEEEAVSQPKSKVLVRKATREL